MRLSKWIGVSTVLFVVGLSCPSHSFTLQQQGLIGWSIKHITINVNYASCPVGTPTLEKALDHALDVWNAVSTSNVLLVRGINTTTTAAAAYGGSATDGPVVVCDTALSATLGRDSENIPGWATINQSSGTIVYGAILLNAEVGKAANVQNLNGDQLELVLAHQVGHLLGLGHSSDTTSLMHHSYTNREHIRLSQDDIDGLTYLYPRVEPDEDKVFGCASMGGSRGPGSGLWVQSLLLILLSGFVTVLLRRPVSA